MIEQFSTIVPKFGEVVGEIWASFSGGNLGAGKRKFVNE